MLQLGLSLLGLSRKQLLKTEFLLKLKNGQIDNSIEIRKE